MTSGSRSSSAALRLGPSVQGISVRNNIFTTDHGPLVAAIRVLRPGRAELQGNDYFSAAGPWSVLWGPAVYGSLSSWRATSSEETVAGHASGFAVNPLMAGPVPDLQQNPAAPAGAGDGFVLRPGSPLIGAGLDLASFGLAPGSANYAGKAVSARHPNVGAQ
jgi:hypothetical protein